MRSLPLLLPADFIKLGRKEREKIVDVYIRVATLLALAKFYAGAVHRFLHLLKISHHAVSDFGLNGVSGS